MSFEIWRRNEIRLIRRPQTPSRCNYTHFRRPSTWCWTKTSKQIIIVLQQGQGLRLTSLSRFLFLSAVAVARSLPLSFSSPSELLLIVWLGVEKLALCFHNGALNDCRRRSECRDIRWKWYIVNDARPWLYIIPVVPTFGGTQIRMKLSEIENLFA